MSYTTKKYIKHGSYGEVYKCIDKDGKKYAMKKIFHDNTIFGFGSLKELNMLKIMSQCSLFPKLCDVTMEYHLKSRDSFSKKTESITFITELADTDCENFFIDRKKCTFSVCKNLSAQLLCAVEYLHCQRITHRDIKPGNILLRYYDDHMQLKLCDFGFSHFLCDNSPSTPSISTGWYRPPEVCWEITEYGCAADIWSVGKTIYQMFTGSILMKNINHESNADIFNGILSRIPLKMTPEIQELYSHGKVKINIYSVNNIKDKKYVPAPTLLSRFQKLPNYKSIPIQEWRLLEKLLVDCFNLNYRTRKSASDCLKSELFILENEMIHHYQEESRHIQILDFISIVENPSIHSLKVQAFTNFMIQKEYRYDFRILFHALDLSNIYFNYYPQTENVEKVVLATIYFFDKYFATMRFAEAPEFFFNVLPVNITEYNNLDHWVYDFEYDVLNNVLQNYQFYRPGLYEMADEYSIKMTRKQYRLLFQDFLNLTSWSDQSYRAMFRYLYSKRFEDIAKK
jgi:serine/threonine protein kinase